MYQWLLYMDVNLVFPLAISFFNSRVEAAFWKQISVLPLKKNQTKTKPSLVAFPFCRNLSGNICTYAAVLHLESSCATQDRLVWFSSPGSWDVLRAEFFSLGSRGPGCWGIQFSLLNSPVMSHFTDECNNSCKEPCFENKQPLTTTILLLKKKGVRWCIRLRHIRIAFRVSKGLSSEPGTSKENQSPRMLYHTV